MKNRLLFLLLVCGVSLCAVPPLKNPAWLASATKPSGSSYTPVGDSNVKALFRASDIVASDHDGLLALTDASGNGNNLSAAPANMATYRTGVYAGHPAFGDTNTLGTFFTAMARATWAGGSISQPYTICCVLIATNTIAYSSWWDAGDTTAGCLFYAGADGANFRAYAGGAIVGAAVDTAIHSWVVVYNGASSKVYMDGASTTGDTGGNAINGVTLGNMQNISNGSGFFMFEWFIVAADYTSKATDIYNYHKATYGLP